MNRYQQQLLVFIFLLVLSGLLTATSSLFVLDQIDQKTPLSESSQSSSETPQFHNALKFAAFLLLHMRTSDWPINPLHSDYQVVEKAMIRVFYSRPLYSNGYFSAYKNQFTP